MEIRAFRAFRFNSDVVGDVGGCIAPPYDIISPAQQGRLYEKSRYNIVRIIKGKSESGDDENNNQYTRAADYLNKWIEEDALKEDSADAIYAYVQDFEQGQKKYQRFSFIAIAKLEEFGKVVRPHEKTLEKPIIDRLNLLRATSAKFGLVFVMYRDQQHIADEITEKAAKSDALIDFIDEQGVRHRLFAIIDRGDIDAITGMMADKSCIIADGHHRYTTGLTYLKENPEAKYQMMAFANTSHEGLIVLATHRLVGSLSGFSFEKLLVELKKDFEITKFNGPQGKTAAKNNMLAEMKKQMDADKNAFGIYGGGEAFYVAVLKDKTAMDSVAADRSKAWKSLDVSVLHKLILEGLLGVDEDKQAAGGYIEYVKDTESAIDDSIAKVDAGQKQVAFFMNPPKIEQIEQVADEGERMPQKSTYFYPKVYTGLTINKL